MANYLIYNVRDEGEIGASKTISFDNYSMEHKLTLTDNTTLSLDTTAVTPNVFKRLLRIIMPETVYSVTFPNNVVWNRGFAPCMNVPSQQYLVELFTYDNGTTWCGSWVCETEVL